MTRLSILHSIRLKKIRMPDYSFLLSQKGLDKGMSEYLHEFRRNGVVRIENMISANTLAQMQKSFTEVMEKIENEVKAGKDFGNDWTLYQKPLIYDKEERTYATNEPFENSPGLIKVCLDSRINQLINRYLGKQTHITQCLGTRILSHDTTGHGSYQWHHDAWGNRVNMMILLSKVEEDDQAMTYLLGSNRLNHSLDKFINSRISDEEVRKNYSHLKIKKCTGNPGDIILLDSNGIHSGNRTLGRTRDTYLVMYSDHRSAQWVHNLPQEYLSEYTSEQTRPFEWMIEDKKNKKSLCPSYVSYTDSLPFVRKWLF